MNGRWPEYLIFLAVSALAVVLMRACVAPMLRDMGDLEQGAVTCIAMVVAIGFSISFINFYQRLRGYGKDEPPEPDV